MSSRKRKPQGLVVEAVIQQMEESWNASTREVARTDSSRVLEALMPEYGIDGGHGGARPAGIYGIGLLVPIIASVL